MDGPDVGVDVDVAGERVGVRVGRCGAEPVGGAQRHQRRILQPPRPSRWASIPAMSAHHGMIASPEDGFVTHAHRLSWCRQYRRPHRRATFKTLPRRRPAPGARLPRAWLLCTAAASSIPCDLSTRSHVRLRWRRSVAVSESESVSWAPVRPHVLADVELSAVDIPTMPSFNPSLRPHQALQRHLHVHLCSIRLLVCLRRRVAGVFGTAPLQHSTNHSHALLSPQLHANIVPVLLSHTFCFLQSISDCNPQAATNRPLSLPISPCSA